jgi:hypothetical protein
MTWLVAFILVAVVLGFAVTLLLGFSLFHELSLLHSLMQRQANDTSSLLMSNHDMAEYLRSIELNTRNTVSIPYMTTTSDDGGSMPLSWDAPVFTTTSFTAEPEPTEKPKKPRKKAAPKKDKS